MWADLLRRVIVHAEVSPVAAMMHERLAAEFADVCLDVSVNGYVVLKVMMLEEVFAAYVAQESTLGSLGAVVVIRLLFLFQGYWEQTKHAVRILNYVMVICNDVNYFIWL